MAYRIIVCHQAIFPKSAMLLLSYAFALTQAAL